MGTGKMKSKKLLIAIAIFMTTFLNTSLFAEGMMKVVGGVNMGFYTEEPASSDSYFPFFGFNIGALYGFTLGENNELEVGAIYGTYQKVTLYDSGDSLFISYQSVTLPVLYRFGLGPVSLGLGGFYEFHVGQVTSTYESYGSTVSTGSYSDANMSESNYGILAAAGLKIDFSESFYLLFDFRYKFGLANLATTSGNTLTLGSAELLFMVGFKI